jgi:hypothetical protein
MVLIGAGRAIPFALEACAANGVAFQTLVGPVEHFKVVALALASLFLLAQFPELTLVA